MTVAALVSPGVGGASRSSTEMGAVGSAIPLFLRPCSFSAELGARVTVEYRADGFDTRVLAVARNFDFLMSLTSGDEIYGAKRLRSSVNGRTVRPSEGSRGFCPWAN